MDRLADALVRTGSRAGLVTVTRRSLREHRRRRGAGRFTVVMDVVFDDGAVRHRLGSYHTRSGPRRRADVLSDGRARSASGLGNGMTATGTVPTAAGTLQRPQPIGIFDGPAGLLLIADDGDGLLAGLAGGELPAEWPASAAVLPAVLADDVPGPRPAGRGPLDAVNRLVLAPDPPTWTQPGRGGQ